MPGKAAIGGSGTRRRVSVRQAAAGSPADGTHRRSQSVAMDRPADTARRRDLMVAAQLSSRDIRDPRVLEAMGTVPREFFLPPGMEEFAYEDGALPIESGQTISQPYIVACMIQAAELGPGDRVLEVGAGSGYAAAVMSRIAAHVHAIERHASLAQGARAHLDSLRYDNVDVHVGDGTLGWPAGAPYDAIIVSAGGPEVPAALKAQLALGGRLVIPTGTGGDVQELRKLTRVAHGEQDAAFVRENLGGVRFVPLIGAQGWSETGERSATRHAPGRGRSLESLLAETIEPLPPLEDARFAAAFDRWADRRVILLGEASHGTAEFYRARAAITRRLIEHHGFDIVAVEADWPDAAALDRYVRGGTSAGAPTPPFQRFPRWMWRNVEVATFIRWLHDFNAGRPAAARCAFRGLDIYNLHGSIAAVLDYLEREDPEAARIARERYGCLTPWQHDPATYGRAVLSDGYRKCEDAVVAQCRELLARRLEEQARGDAAAEDNLLDAAQNARLVASAERYYRVMYYGGAESWNLRDTHMFETLQQLLEARGPRSRAVVWAHNSHIGDARRTDMGSVRGELNLGQLCRERFGEDCALIGFGTHTGTVAAADDWDGDMRVMRVRPSLRDSVERLSHDTGIPRFLLDFARDEALARLLGVPRQERFIGVVYRPQTELHSHYAEVSLSRQFDGWVWFDETTAVTPLGDGTGVHDGAAETWPFGL